MQRIAEKLSHHQVHELLAEVQLNLATMYARKLMAFLLFYAHSMRDKMDGFPMTAEELQNEEMDKLTKKESTGLLLWNLW